VGISCFWHSLIGLDRRLRPVTPVLMWGDLRSFREAAGLRRRLGENAYRGRTGCYLHPAYPPAKMLWVRKQAPGVFRGISRWVSMDSYILGRLQGDYRLSHPMAAGTGLYHQSRATWDEETLEALALSPRRLPGIRPADRAGTGLKGEYRELLAPLREVPIYPALPDGYCAQVGSGCGAPGQAALTLGTSGALRVLVRARSMPAVARGLWCYRVAPDAFLVGGAVNNVGNLIAWLQRTLALEAPSRSEESGTSHGLSPETAFGFPAAAGKTDRNGAGIRAEAAAMHSTASLRSGTGAGDSGFAALDGAPGLAVLPFFQGERSPQWPLQAFGVISGLRMSTTAAEIYQASLEAVGFQFGRILRLLEKGCFVQGEAIRVSGGIREPLLFSALADILGRPLQVLAEKEISALGAACRVRKYQGLPPPALDQTQARSLRVAPASGRRQSYARAAASQESLYRLFRKTGQFI